MKLFKTLAAAAIAVTAAFVAPAAQAGLIATISVDGDYTFQTGTSGGTTFGIEGTWAAEVLTPIPGNTQNYVLGANVVITENDGNQQTEVVNLGGQVGPVSLNFNDAIASLTPLINALIAGANTPQNFGLGTLVYGGSLDPMSTATSLFGNWGLKGETLIPVGDIPVGSALAPILAGTPLAGLIPTNFTFPNNSSGSFSIGLTASVAPIPLPAGGLLMLSALGGLGALRARKKILA